MENKNFEYSLLHPTALEMIVSRQHWWVSESNVLEPQHWVFGRLKLSSPSQQINIELLTISVTVLPGVTAWKYDKYDKIGHNRGYQSCESGFFDGKDKKMEAYLKLEIFGE